MGFNESLRLLKTLKRQTQNEHSGNLPPPKTNMTLEIPMFNRQYIFKWWIFHCHVTVVLRDVKIPLSLHHPHAQLLRQTLGTGFRFRIITETLHGWRLGGKMAETHVEPYLFGVPSEASRWYPTILSEVLDHLPCFWCAIKWMCIKIPCKPPYFWRQPVLIFHKIFPELTSAGSRVEPHNPTTFMTWNVKTSTKITPLKTNMSLKKWPFQ